MANATAKCMQSASHCCAVFCCDHIVFKQHFKKCAYLFTQISISRYFANIVSKSYRICKLHIDPSLIESNSVHPYFLMRQTCRTESTSLNASFYSAVRISSNIDSNNELAAENKNRVLAHSFEAL